MTKRFLGLAGRAVVAGLTWAMLMGCSVRDLPPSAALTGSEGTSATVSNPAPAAVPAPVMDPTRPLKHRAVGAKVVVSSTHVEWPGEGEAGALVDGDLQTRWSSEYEAPQFVTVTLAEPCRLEKVALYWEHAFATRYTLSVSSDGTEWQRIHACMKASSQTNAGVDVISVKRVEALAIRLDLEKRVNPEWGFSLYEVAVNPGR